MSSIGDRIKNARTAQNLSQVDLAHITNVSQPTIANLGKQLARTKTRCAQPIVWSFESFYTLAPQWR